MPAHCPTLAAPKHIPVPSQDVVQYIAHKYLGLEGSVKEGLGTAIARAMKNKDILQQHIARRKAQR